MKDDIEANSCGVVVRVELARRFSDRSHERFESDSTIVCGEIIIGHFLTFSRDGLRPCVTEHFTQRNNPRIPEAGKLWEAVFGFPLSLRLARHVK